MAATSDYTRCTVKTGDITRLARIEYQGDRVPNFTIPKDITDQASKVAETIRNSLTFQPDNFKIQITREQAGSRVDYRVRAFQGNFEEHVTSTPQVTQLANRLFSELPIRGATSLSLYFESRAHYRYLDVATKSEIKTALKKSCTLM